MRIGAKITGIHEVQAELARVGTLPRQALAQTAEEVEVFVEGAAARHNRTGAMVRAIYKARTPTGWEIGHDAQVAPYTGYVHWGARPHDIFPKSKKLLRWSKGGKFHFAKAVHHPGYRGDPWMTSAAAMAPTAFNEALQRLMNKEA